MQKTAEQLGRDVKLAGRLAPTPLIEIVDIKRYVGQGWFLKDRQPENYFLAERSGYATLYVAPRVSNQLARAVYADLFGPIPPGRHIEHLYPRSRAILGQLVALGHIPGPINSSHGNRGSELEFAFKAMGYRAIEYRPFSEAGWMITGGPTARQLGLIVQHGYLVPVCQVDRNKLTPVSI